MKQSNNSVAGWVVVSALALGAATAVFAAGNQYPGGYPGMMGGPGMMHGPRMMGGPGMGMMAGPGMMGTAADMAKRLDEVKGELGITSAQEDAWNAYQQAMVTQSALMNAHRHTMWNGSTPPSVGQRTAMHQQGAATMQQRLKATQDLYHVLTPEQQTKANTLLSFHRGMGMYR
jgi:Spy/CpxP family protein refolding chaperone